MTNGPVQPLAAGDDEERRYLAIRHADPSTPDALLAALADPSWRVRHAAAERLAEADPARAVPLLVAALGVESTPGRRNAAAAALAQIGSAAAPALVAALESSAAEFRTAAIEVLGEIRDVQAVAALAARLDDPAVNARIAAAEALAKIGGDAAVAALHGGLERPRDLPTARALLEAMASLRAPPAIARLRALADDRELLRPVLHLCGFGRDPAAFDLLAAGLSGLSRSAREAALQGLGEQRLRGCVPAGAAREAIRAAVPGLLPLAASLAIGAEEPALRAGALTVLQLAGIPGDVHAIAAAADDDRVRQVVAEVLDEMGPPGADALVETLPSLSPVAHVVALAALARWRDERAFPRLVAALVTDDATARGLAIEALGRLGDDRAVPHLVALLTGDDRVASGHALTALLELAGEGPALRAAVLEACRRPEPHPGTYRLLAQIGEERDLPRVQAGLRSHDRALRATAAHAVGAMPVRAEVRLQAAADLLDAIADEEASVRAEAARALGVVAAGERPQAPSRGDEVRRALAIALRDGDAAVRAAAALGLAECRATEHAGALAEMVRDAATPGVVAAASVRALSRMGRIDAGTLSAAAVHGDAEVVKEAVLAATLLPEPDATRLLLNAASHARWDVRRAAATSLARYPVPAVLEALRRLARSERDPLVLEALASALRSIEAGPSA